MSAEPETTLAWAEFLWRVAKEAPEVVFAYIILFEYVRSRYRPEDTEGRDLTLDLSDSVAIVNSLTIGTATETDIALPLRTVKRITLGIAEEHDIALPVKVDGGAPR